MKKHLHLWLSGIAALICFGVFAAAIIYPAFEARITERALWIFAAGIGCLLFTFVSKLKIGTLLEIERLESKVKQLVRGEVLRSSRGECFYVDGEGKRFLVPDRETTDFLATSRGPILMTDVEIEEYPLRGEIDSVKKCQIVEAKGLGHVFVLLSGKKYYLGSWSPVFDWGRADEKHALLELAAIRAIPTGK
ncbi:MAG: hypothetical protein Q7S40_06420 [Opitutaceae bacterium]|nr:hypothetical protein [Opitutaceae bacterium]